MSQRAVLRGFFLCILAVLAALRSEAQITFAPGTVSFGVGETSELITATIAYATTPPTGLQTLTFVGPSGITTVPSTVTFMPPFTPGSVNVQFRLVASAAAPPGSGQEVEVSTLAVSPAFLYFDLSPVGITPPANPVIAGATTGTITATLSWVTTPPGGTQVLVIGGLPAGATTVPSPVTFTPPAGWYTTVTFAIATTTATPVGSHVLTASTSSIPGGTATFSLDVQAPPTLAIVPGSASVSACAGGSPVPNSVTITAGGFSGSAFVSFPSLPADLTVTPTPPIAVTVGAVPQSVAFQVSALTGASPGPHTVNVQVEAPSVGISATTTFTVNVGVPDFAPVVSPASVSLAPGGPSAGISVSAIPALCPPYSSLSVFPTSVPPGIAVNPEFVVLDPPSFLPAGFTLAATGAAQPGTWAVEFTYSADGMPMKTRVVEVLVRAPGSLSVTVEKESVDACPGGPALTNSVTVVPLDGYTGTPTVTFPVVADEVTVTPSEILVDALPPARTMTFDVSAKTGALPGPKVVNVLVSDPAGPYGVASFVVNVRAADYTPVVSPASIALVSGGDGVTVTASLAPGACAPPATILVTPSGLPEGVTVTPASAYLLATSYTPVDFTFSASASVPTGNVEVTFTFTTSTGTPKTTTTPVSIVRNGTLGVAVERASMDVCPGGADAPNSLTVTPVDGYTGSPTVSFPTLPSGITVSPASVPVPVMPPARVVTFAVRADPGMAPGPVTVTVLVSDPRGISTTTTFVANVLPPDFKPVVAPSDVTLNAGGASASIATSLFAGDCAPTSDVTVTPSLLPPGVTVTPTSAVLAAPAFAPAEFTVQASSSTLPGPTTIVFTFTTVGRTSKSATATITVCGPPAAPESLIVRPRGNPLGPVTATDLLALEWGAPTLGFAPTRYEWRLNGSSWSSVAGTSASAPPRGSIDPVQLFVRGYSCDPERGPGAEAASPVYALSAPVASFSVPASIVAGRAVTFTDSSSPQATSWLWFPGDGIPATTVQSPTVTFPAAGPKVIVLVASNGSGSSSKSTTINVLPASAARAAESLTVRSLDPAPDGRLALDRVEVDAGSTLFLRRIDGEGEAVAFLRLVDADQKVVVERRLVLSAGEEARHDLSAWGVRGVFRVELVGPEGLDAAVEKLSIPLDGPETPAGPRMPRSAEIP